MDSKYQFVLSKIIMERNAFTGCVIYAKQRLGKSSYALQVLHDIFKGLHPDWTDERCWNEVFANLFFKLEDIIDYLTKALESDKVIPAIIWDDAGLHASKFKYFSDKDSAQLLQGLFDVVGTGTRAIIMTTPNPGNLLKSLRDYEFYKVKIVKHNNNGYRVAKGYGMNLMPSGATRVYREFEDNYIAYLPDDVYQRYCPIRKGFYISALKALKDHIKKSGVRHTDEGIG